MFHSLQPQGHSHSHTHNTATSRKEKGKRKKEKKITTILSHPIDSRHPAPPSIRFYSSQICLFTSNTSTFFFHSIYPLTYLGICSPSPPPHHTTHTYTPRPPIIGKPLQSPSPLPGVGVEGGVAVVARRAEGHFTRIRSSVYIHVHIYVHKTKKTKKQKNRVYYYFET